MLRHFILQRVQDMSSGRTSAQAHRASQCSTTQAPAGLQNPPAGKAQTAFSGLQLQDSLTHTLQTENKNICWAALKSG